MIGLLIILTPLAVFAAFAVYVVMRRTEFSNPLTDMEIEAYQRAIREFEAVKQ